MIQWWYSISDTLQAILAVLAVVGLYQLYFLMRYMLLRRSCVKPKDSSEKPDNEQVKGVSVIVAAKNEAENIRTYLHALLEQDYPLFEVIVVNDGSEDDTQEVLDDYATRYKDLHLTFVPQQAKVISSKKLAITLGVKAAKYDYLLLTDADCCPASPHWIKEMVRGFDNEKTDIVLGYGAYFHRHTFLNRLIQYETLLTGLQYMGMAVAGHPYMGVGRNLAYKKSLFVLNNGFVGFTNEQAGDDDLLVNRLAQGRNTSVVCTRDSLTWSVPESKWSDWWQQRKRHLSVAPRYRIGSRLRIGLEPLTRMLWYAGIAALLIVGTPVLQIAAAGLFLMRWCLQWIVYNVSAKRLGVPAVGTELMLWDWLYPLITLWIMWLPKQKNRYW
ncbi:MAG: glycosyltransferase [Paludibacteraceae bacterium]|nr:glycosyltransferase [Paludibacteraceae bacterium]